MQQNGVSINGPLPMVGLSETPWGYVIRSDMQLSGRAALIERVCAITGLAFMFAAFGNWLFPQVHAAVDGGVSTMWMSTVLLAFPALLFLWISERGMSHDVEVDVTKSQLRLSVSNRYGRSRVVNSIPFDHVGSAYVKRTSDYGSQARLYLRLSGSKGILQVASGRESTMRVLHERLSHELRPVRVKLGRWERVGRKLQPAAVNA